MEVPPPKKNEPIPPNDDVTACTHSLFLVIGVHEDPEKGSLFNGRVFCRQCHMSGKWVSFGTEHPTTAKHDKQAIAEFDKANDLFFPGGKRKGGSTLKPPKKAADQPKGAKSVKPLPEPTPGKKKKAKNKKKRKK